MSDLIEIVPPEFSSFPAGYYNRLITGFVHKLNNVTTVLTGHTGLLLMDSDLPEAVREPVESMARATQLLSRYIDEFGAQAKRKELQIQPIFLTKILETPIHSNKVSLSGPQDQTGQIEVLADAQRLRRTVTEICANAEDAGATAVSCSFEVEPDKVQIGFRDNGEGIRPELSNRIFDPFFSTRKAPKNLGLGLFLMQADLREMKGSLKAITDGRSYSQFIVTLPRSP